MLRHSAADKNIAVWLNPGAGVSMTIGTEILSLRRDRSSSVETLLGLIDWERQAWEPDHRTSRHYAVLQAADTVLMAVAVHAAEAERDMMIPPGTRRAIDGTRRFRRSRPGHLSQRIWWRAVPS